MTKTTEIKNEMTEAEIQKVHDTLAVNATTPGDDRTVEEIQAELVETSSEEQTGTVTIDPVTLEETGTPEIMDIDEFDKMIGLLGLKPGITMMLRELLEVEPCNLTKEEIVELEATLEKVHMGNGTVEDIKDNELVVRASMLCSSEEKELTVEERITKLLDMTKVNIDELSDPDCLNDVFNKLYDNSISREMKETAREKIEAKLNILPEGLEKTKAERTLALIDAKYKNVEYIAEMAKGRVNFLLRGWNNTINKEYNKFAKALPKEQIVTMPDLSPLAESMMYVMSFGTVYDKEPTEIPTIAKKILFVLFRLNNTRVMDRKCVSLFIRHLTKHIYNTATSLNEFAKANEVQLMVDLKDKYEMTEEDKVTIEMLKALYELIKG